MNPSSSSSGFQFANYSFDVALRAYLGHFVLPGEAQKIDRILQAFAKAYYEANRSDPSVCKSEDAVYTLAFSIVLLNTDAHNPHLAKRFKMKKEDFLRNHQRLGDGKQIPASLLGELFESFATYAITVIPSLPDDPDVDDETDIVFGDGSLGLDIETSIDGRTCLVKQYTEKQPNARWSCSPKHALDGWVIVGVGHFSTRKLGYELTRYLLKTTPRPVSVRFCEPSIYFASIAT